MLLFVYRDCQEGTAKIKKMPAESISNSKVYIIILNYKNWQDVADCLESVFRSAYSNICVIVIDNDSQNNSLEYLMQWADTQTVFSASLPFLASKSIHKPIAYKYFHKNDLLSQDIDIMSFPRLVFIQNDKNNGFAHGNNVALQLLLKEDAYVWLLNPDMIVQQNTLTELVNFAHNHPFKSVIGAVLKFYSNPDKVYLYGGGRINFNSATISVIGEIQNIPKVDYVSGGSMFIHAKHLGDVGLLPGDYFLYWEEADWCYQAKKKGYQMLVCLSAICYDKISTVIGKSFLADFYYTRNGLLFISRYKRSKIRVALFLSVFRLVKRIATLKWDRARGVYRGIRSFLNIYNHENK